MTETDSTLFTTQPNITATAHTTIKQQKNYPPKNGRNKSQKTFHKMYVNVGMANREKRPKQERDDIRFTHIAIPTSFYPSPPRSPTQYPHADYLSIHHHPCNPQNSIAVVTSLRHHKATIKNHKLQAMLQPNNQPHHQSPTRHTSHIQTITTACTLAMCL